MSAFHWATFGSHHGISLTLNNLEDALQSTLTSLVSRGSVYLLVVMPDWQITSVALDITKKATEFMFQKKPSQFHCDETQALSTVNNCLLDCYSDVWGRFPVAPAVQRQMKHIAKFEPKRIICATPNSSFKVGLYFSQMIKNFERKTRKPTGRELKLITVESWDPAVLHTVISGQLGNITSCFNLGGWLVDVLCLIPIHIAITQENRFIPLKDGVTSAEYERSVLGFDVSGVVESISFGWYESILQTYMAAKVRF